MAAGAREAKDGGSLEERAIPLALAEMAKAASAREDAAASGAEANYRQELRMP